jgi:hypothetical protein
MAFIMMKSYIEKRTFDVFQAAIEFEEDMWRDLTGMGHKKALP